MQDIQDLPAHHFNNRGGVLVKKQFAGFEKYHKNTDEMMDWYAKAFPSQAKEWKRWRMLLTYSTKELMSLFNNCFQFNHILKIKRKFYLIIQVAEKE